VAADERYVRDGAAAVGKKGRVTPAALPISPFSPPTSFSYYLCCGQPNLHKGMSAPQLVGRARNRRQRGGEKKKGKGWKAHACFSRFPLFPPFFTVRAQVLGSAGFHCFPRTKIDGGGIKKSGVYAILSLPIPIPAGEDARISIATEDIARRVVGEVRAVHVSLFCFILLREKKEAENL